MSCLIEKMKQELEEEVWYTNSHLVWALNGAHETYLKILNAFFNASVYKNVYVNEIPSKMLPIN